MKPIHYTTTHGHPYKFMGAMLAPKGAYYIDYSDNWAVIFPVMYIQLWQDPDGVVWNVPLWSEELQESHGDSFTGTFQEPDGDIYAGTFQEYIEDLINEDRHVETCLSCKDFVNLCQSIRQTSKDAIIIVMNNLCEDVIKGNVGTTPELRAYFKDGVWGNLRTMANDGTLPQGWQSEYLTTDGSLKPTE